MRYLFLLLVALLFSVPANAQVGANSLCYTTDGSNCVPAIAANKSVAVNVATSSTLITAATSTPIYITSFNLFASGTTTAQLQYGTGTLCATNNGSLTGPYGFKDQAMVTAGSGLGTVLYVPPGYGVCLILGSAIQVSGSISYTQF